MCDGVMMVNSVFRSFVRIGESNDCNSVVTQCVPSARWLTLGLC